MVGGGNDGSDEARAAFGATPNAHTISLPDTPERTTPTVVFEAGARIGRYEVLSIIGAGGMGLVVKAYDAELEREVAIKLVRPRGASVEAHSRLVREARALARLRHANVVPIYDVGVVGDQVFVVMPFVAGGTLGTWLREAKRSWREVVAHFVAAGVGLGAAHAAGLVHRDFKPDNVLVGDDGTVLVADFGLASEKDGEVIADSEPLGHDADSRRVAGTLAYMAPEQLAGERIDERADQFAFCVALWEAVYGRRPFDGDSPATTIDEQLARIDEGIAEPVASSVPASLRGAVARGLAKAPSERWPEMRSLLDALPNNSRTRRRWVAIAVVASLVVGAAAIVFAKASSSAASQTLVGAPILRTDGRSLSTGEFFHPYDGSIGLIENGAMMWTDGEGQRAIPSPNRETPLIVTSSLDHLMVVTGSDTDRSLWRTGLQGEDALFIRHLHELEHAYSFSLSPDERQFLFSDGTQLVIEDSATHAQRKLEGTGFFGVWSPDAKRVAITREAAVEVVDLATNRVVRILDRAFRATWFGDDRFIVYGRPSGLLETGLVVDDLVAGTSTHLADVPGQIIGMVATKTDILVQTEELNRQFVTLSPDGGEVTPLESGASHALYPLGWSTDSQPIMLVLAEQRMIVKGVGTSRRALTKPGGTDIFFDTFHRGLIFYTVAHDDRCETRRLDVDREVDTLVEAGTSCRELSRIKCARIAPICFVRRDNVVKWFDPVSLQTGAGAPERITKAFTTGNTVNLSPDGRQFTSRGTSLSIVDVETGSEELVLPPDESFFVDSAWLPGGELMLIARHSNTYSVQRRDHGGALRTIIATSPFSLYGLVSTIDGGRLLGVTEDPRRTWFRFPHPSTR